MDDDEYDELRWAQLQEQFVEHEKYQQSIAGRLEWFLRDLFVQTLALELSAAALERALDRRRVDVAEKWEKESAAKKAEMLRRAKDTLLPRTEAFDSLIGRGYTRTNEVTHSTGSLA